MKEISRQYWTCALSADDPPAAHIRPGETVRFETFDCYHASLLPEGSTFANVDRSVGNPATGPVYVDSAKPGDMLKIHVDRIEFGPVGILDIGPTSGALAGIFDEPVINRLRVQDGMIDYKGIKVPVRPMIGVIGVAPAGEPVSTMTPMDHGGNMDCNRIEEGATLYLPVFVPGALLSIGDFHAIMGDGEIGNCGLEIEGWATLTVDVIPQTGLSFPMIENDHQWVTVAYGDTLDEASVKASRQMFHFLTEKLGLAKDDAGMLLDMAGELMVCQIVNPKKTARIEVPKDLIRKMKKLQPGSADPAWTAQTGEIRIEQEEIRRTAEQGGIFMYQTIAEKFDHLGVDNAPGQESQQKEVALDLRGEKLEGPVVDFSHGDVDAHKPTPGSFEVFAAGVEEGGSQAYTPYKGKPAILEMVAERISAFAGVSIDPKTELLLTGGTQGALFLAMGSNIMPGDKVAFVEPDYFANRKMVEFFNGEMVPIHMAYEEARGCSGIDLEELEKAFQDGAKLFIFSNPNNPVGCIYSPEEIARIASMAKRYGATLIVDELYSRQVYPGLPYTHLCAQEDAPENIITIMGPSKTESLSGYRLGAAFGNAAIIERMEKLQAIMALRCSGYNQAVFKTWFNEPEGWLADRVAQHQQIRDDLMKVIEAVPGVTARPTEGGSYLFVTIPELEVSLHDFIRIVRELAGVIVTPGTEFGPQYLHSFRINFSQDHDKAVDAMKRLFTVMERYRK